MKYSGFVNSVGIFLVYREYFLKYDILNLIYYKHKTQIHLLFEKNLSCNKEKLINPGFINLSLIHVIFRYVFLIDRSTVIRIIEC